MTNMLKRAIEEASRLSDSQQDAIAQLVLAETMALKGRDLASDRFLATHRDAPIDDEPWTDEDQAALREGLRDLEQGLTVSQEDLRRELGG